MVFDKDPVIITLIQYYYHNGNAIPQNLLGCNDRDASICRYVIKTTSMICCAVFLLVMVNHPIIINVL